MNEQSYNKEIAISFYRDVIGRRDIVRAGEIIAEHYIQHNPQVKTGRAGVLEAIEYLKKMPSPPADSPSPIRRVIADGDLVALHLAVDMMGKRKYVMDLFRVEHGQLVEHWDAVDEEPAQREFGLSMIDGPTTVEDAGDTHAHKQVVQAFARQVLEGRDERGLSELVADALIQHDPVIGQGRRGLEDFLHDPRFIWKKVHRIVGEGNMVVMQSEILVEGRPFVRYDLFRLSGGKIVEQWRVQQAVPEAAMNDNGMV